MASLPDRYAAPNCAADQLHADPGVVSGIISDRSIRRTHFIDGAMLMTTALAYPFYAILANYGVWCALVVQFALAIRLIVPLGAVPAMFVEFFLARDRLSGWQVSCNIGLGIVGGTMPMCAKWLIKISGNRAAPAGMLRGVIHSAEYVQMHDHANDRWRQLC